MSSNFGITDQFKRGFEMDKVTENKETYLLDLPEEMILFILTYLEDAELFFNVRCVCQRLKRVVQNYIEIGKY